MLFFQADEVARRSLSALKRKSVVYVPGFLVQAGGVLHACQDWVTG